MAWISQRGLPEVAEVAKQPQKLHEAWRQSQTIAAEVPLCERHQRVGPVEAALGGIGSLVQHTLPGR